MDKQVLRNILRYEDVVREFLDGKAVQCEQSTGSWMNVDNPKWDGMLAYRIKPEEKYRAWKTVKEVPLNCYVTIKTGVIEYRICAVYLDNNNELRVILVGNHSYDVNGPHTMLDGFKMADGTPCGVIDKECYCD